MINTSHDSKECLCQSELIEKTTFFYLYMSEQSCDDTFMKCFMYQFSFEFSLQNIKIETYV